VLSVIEIRVVPGVLSHLALPVLVPGPGTANLVISNSATLPSGHVPVGDPQGRSIRWIRHAGNQVVRIGSVCQALSVFVAATPLPRPRPSFSRGRPEAQLLGHFGPRQFSHGGGPFFRLLVITAIFAWIHGNRCSPACVQTGMDESEREVIRAEGLDPDDPAVQRHAGPQYGHSVTASGTLKLICSYFLLEDQ
jgi:hypothetical protein